MPLFTKNINKQNSQQTQASQTQQQNQLPPKEDKQNNLLKTLSQCLPFLPLLFEQFTGQKIPQLQGTIAEMSNALSQIQLNQTQILANQEELVRHVENLESQANNQLANIDQQMQTLKNTYLKLTHEKKEVELRSNGGSLDNERQFKPNSPVPNPPQTFN